MLKKHIDFIIDLKTFKTLVALYYSVFNMWRKCQAI